jgi:putative tryptophan/tyrosine transport system substrate-binding protein
MSRSGRLMNAMLSRAFSCLCGQRLLLTMGGAFLILLLMVAGCGKSPKHYRVGILSGLDFFANTADGFRARMAELGYVEGKNISYDFHRTNFEPARELEILESFVKEKVDLVLVFPTEVSIQGRIVSDRSGIPTVFANANIEGVKLVKSIREPGGNVTGVRFPGPDIAARRLEVLHELVPHARNILVPYKRDYPIVENQLEAIQSTARSFGGNLITLPVDNCAELEAKLQAQLGPKRRADAILMIPEPIAVSPEGFRILGKFSSANKLPAGGAFMSQDGFASLFGVSTDNIAVGRQAATIADKIFKGARPGTIPVVSAETFIQINMGAVRAFGLDIPVALLKQADRVDK